MTALPDHTVTVQDIAAWEKLVEELRRAKAAEMVLRTKIFKHFFPAPVEGTNTAPLANGYVLKGKYSITRDVDPAAFGVLRPMLLEAGVRTDDIVQYKPSLALAMYRGLTEEQMHLMDRCLVIKPGSPALEIVLPAKAKVAA